MDTLKPCKPVSNKQLDEMNEQIEQLRDVIGMLSSDLDDLKANLVVDKGTISNLSSDTINTNDLYVNNNAEIKNAIISYIEKNHQYFNTMENHLDFGSFTNEADLDIILRAEEDEQIIKIHIAENMAVSYSNAKSICNSIKLYKKDNKLYLSGNNLKPGKEVLVLIYAASDEFAINQPVPVDAALLGEAKVSSKFDIQSVDRPEWNNKALALLADVVSGGVTKTYKGVLETEDELPQNDNKQGDLYIIKLTKKGYVGEAVFDGLAWVVQSFYELQFYFNKDEVSKLTDDIINGITPVKAVAQGATSGGHTLALTDDALMLYGAQGMDNIPESSSLDDLIKCGQYSADNELAGTITDKPEEGAFDLIVGYALADKNNPYQVFINTSNGHIYRRSSTDGVYNKWTQYATTNSALCFSSLDNTHGAVAGGDFNDERYRQPGVYVWTYADYQKAVNKPPFIINGGTLYTFWDYNTANGSFVFQVFVSYSSNSPIICYRKYYVSIDKPWSDWQQIATTKDCLTFKNMYITTLTGTIDFNNLVDGVYEVANSQYDAALNKPPVKTAYYVISLSSGSGCQRQVAFSRDDSSIIFTRIRFGSDSWRGWSCALTNDNGWDFNGGTTLPNKVDMKTIKAFGTYYCSDANVGPVDKPSGMGAAGTLKVYSAQGSSIFLTQEWTDYNQPGRMARRTSSDSGKTWSHWFIFQGTDSGA